MGQESLDELADLIETELGQRRSGLLYAPNSTGKTRLAQHLKDRDPDGVLLYSALVEDGFGWDNERRVLKMGVDSELIDSISTQGLDHAIVDSFRFFTGEKIEPVLDMTNGEVVFGLHTGDDSAADGIKISRAEESLFVWCVYYSVLSDAVDALLEPQGDRPTNQYDEVRVVVIDDPVSSMDDERIVSVAISIANLIRRAAPTTLKFLVTTHHALFFNVLFNELDVRRSKKHEAYILQARPDAGWTLKPHPRDSPFSYHLEVIGEIERAIEGGTVRRMHFNQFRTLLEKTANFLGYAGGWSRLLTGNDKDVLTRVLNLYSHDRLSDLEPADVPKASLDAFTAEFEQFLKEFRWGVKGGA